MMSVEERLPTRYAAQKILDTVESHRVSIIMGDTGCGKSSVVPQLLLEEDSTCFIMCTQPRRLAAVSIAQRVASQRGCVLGEEVGYHIGQKVLLSSSTRLTFASCGMFLEELKAGICKYDYIIMDEVHERSVESDLLLALIKTKLSTVEFQNVKLLLMSATCDDSRYIDYFGLPASCVLRIPAILSEDAIPATRVLYLEHIIELVSPNTSVLSQHVKTLNRFKDQSSTAVSLNKSMLDLLHDVIVHIHTHEENLNLTVLVFLPLYWMLEDALDVLSTSFFLSDLDLYVFHSSVDIDACMEAMSGKQEDSRRKVILTSNISESSVTIPSCAFVVDFCRSASIFWDQSQARNRLSLTWCSISQLEQRKGRTGRTCAGTVYRMIPKNIIDTLDRYDPPVLPNLSLRKELLSLSSASNRGRVSNVTNILCNALDPPSQETIQHSLAFLEDIGAQKGNSCTFLGHMLASLPITIESSVLMLKGAMIGYWEDVVILTALLNTSPLPIVQHFGKWSKNEHYELYGVHDDDLGDRASILLANVAAVKFYIRAFSNPQRKNVTGEKMELSQEEKLWCKHHYLLPSSLSSVMELVAILTNVIYRYRPSFMSNLDAKPSVIAKHTCQIIERIDDFGENTVANELEKSHICSEQYLKLADIHNDEELDMLRELTSYALSTFVTKTPTQELDEPQVNSDLPEACAFFLLDKCSRGDKCSFSHDHEARKPQCKYGLKCNYGAFCKYRHDEVDHSFSEFQLTLSTVDTKKCFSIETGQGSWAYLVNSMSDTDLKHRNCKCLVLYDDDLSFTESLQVLTRGYYSISAFTPDVHTNSEAASRLDRLANLENITLLKSQSVQNIIMDYSIVFCNFPILQDEADMLSLLSLIRDHQGPRLYLTLSRQQFAKSNLLRLCRQHCVSIATSYTFCTEDYFGYNPVNPNTERSYRYADTYVLQQEKFLS